MVIQVQSKTKTKKTKQKLILNMLAHSEITNVTFCALSIFRPFS